MLEVQRGPETLVWHVVPAILSITAPYLASKATD
jgi:hypothetical protein